MLCHSLAAVTGQSASSPLLAVCGVLAESPAVSSTAVGLGNPPKHITQPSHNAHSSTRDEQQMNSDVMIMIMGNLSLRHLHYPMRLCCFRKYKARLQDLIHSFFQQLVNNLIVDRLFSLWFNV